jgi:NADH-quinone oxidoreductase subunit E
MGETTKDGTITLELTSCLGACGVAPTMMINEEMYGNLTPEVVDTILEKRRKGI